MMSANHASSKLAIYKRSQGVERETTIQLLAGVLGRFADAFGQFAKIVGRLGISQTKHVYSLILI